MKQAIKDFVSYVEKHIKGDEKGEASIFLERFFQALGYAEGTKGAGANIEYRIKDETRHSSKFADLVLKPIVLIEMKKRGENLQIHLQQAFTYWTMLVPNRPQYVVLCNFDEFWIYDFNKDIYRPQEKVSIKNLEDKFAAFGFLFPKPQPPLFEYNKEDVTERAAYHVSHVYKSLIKRGIEPEVALKYCLQLILSLFAEHIDLLKDQIFTRIITELSHESGTGFDTVVRSYDLIGGLFREMNTEGVTAGGYFKGVDYFNGGLFDRIYPIELTKWEIDQIKTASTFNWRNVNPAIFGSIFETALETGERHKLGAHYTHEIDIKKIVDPVIVQPWNEKIDQANTQEDYFKLLTELTNFKVLDPACGSGNFLFIAFKEMQALENRLLSELRSRFNKPTDAKRLVQFLSNYNYLATSQFYGLDIKPFAVELAKVTLMIAKEMAWLETQESYDNKYKPLPLDNLDHNILCCDALLNNDGTQRQWPDADVIIGNPPYQSKNKMLTEFGGEYMNRLWAAYPKMNKYADFCTFWFYRAHQHLKKKSFAGLVGTNTIRENHSRESSLEYILNHGGTIIEAVSSQKWAGTAAVYVSIVCWKKGEDLNPKSLWVSMQNGELKRFDVQYINSSLSLEIDVTMAKVLNTNRKPKRVFQGQTHGHAGFLMKNAKAKILLREHPEYASVLKPFLIGDELVANFNAQPERFVIDFTFMDIFQASSYRLLFAELEKNVLPWREEMAKKQRIENESITAQNPKAKVSKDYINAYHSWWQLRRQKEELLLELKKMKRYIACSRVSLRPIFEFVSVQIHPNDAIMVFLFEDDYSFGIINSHLHWLWYKEKCSTLGTGYRYTADTVWDTFPWPQQPTKKQIENIAKAARSLRDKRNEILKSENLCLKDIYKMLEKPGKNILRKMQDSLNQMVIQAYGFSESKDLLKQLLELNLSVATKESAGETIQAPGLPEWFTDKEKVVSDDCVEFDSKQAKL